MGFPAINFMTFDKLKETVVEKNKYTTVKDLIKVVINLALSVFCYSLALGVAINSILGYRFLLAILLIAVFAFLWTCDLAAESKESYLKVKKITKFWWTGIVLLVVVCIVLKIFNFL